MTIAATSDLLASCGGAYHCNLDVFRRLMNTITGWPGGCQPL